MNRYKLFEHDTFIGIYTAKEISDMLNISTNMINNYANDKRAYNKRYYFEIEENLDDLKDEWDDSRLSILNAPDKFVRVITLKPFWKNQKPIVKKFPISIDK